MAFVYSDTSECGDEAAASEVDPHYTMSAFEPPQCPTSASSALRSILEEEAAKKKKAHQKKEKHKNKTKKQPDDSSEDMRLTTDSDVARRRQANPWQAPLESQREYVDCKLGGLEAEMHALQDEQRRLIADLDVEAVRDELSDLQSDLLLRDQEGDRLRDEVADLKQLLAAKSDALEAITGQLVRLELRLEPITNGSVNTLHGYLKYKHKFLALRNECNEAKKASSSSS